jgi:hypothetical protein
MEMDRPHIEKTTKYYNQTGFVLEPAGFLPKNTRRRDLEKDWINFGKSSRELVILVKNRRTWNVIVTGLCPHVS